MLLSLIFSSGESVTMELPTVISLSSNFGMSLIMLNDPVVENSRDGSLIIVSKDCKELSFSSVGEVNSRELDCERVKRGCERLKW